MAEGQYYEVRPRPEGDASCSQRRQASPVTQGSKPSGEGSALSGRFAGRKGSATRDAREAHTDSNRPANQPVSLFLR